MQEKLLQDKGYIELTLGLGASNFQGSCRGNSVPTILESNDIAKIKQQFCAIYATEEISMNQEIKLICTGRYCECKESKLIQNDTDVDNPWYQDTEAAAKKLIREYLQGKQHDFAWQTVLHQRFIQEGFYFGNQTHKIPSKAFVEKMKSMYAGNTTFEVAVKQYYQQLKQEVQASLSSSKSIKLTIAY